MGDPAVAPLSGAILAGGASRRLGSDKALVTLGPDGPPLVARVLAAASAVAGDLVLIAPERAAYARFGVPLVPDDAPGLGPLGGIATALRRARHEHCLVLSCDLPFLSVPLLRWFAAQPRDYDVLLAEIPVGGTPRLQPLHAIYARACLPAIERQIATGDLSLSALIAHLDVRRVPEQVLRALDPDLRSFLNVNTPDDLRRAIALAT